MGREAAPPTDPVVDEPAEGNEPEAAPPASLSAEAVRNSPEFRVLQQQNRTLARQAGQLTRERDRARTEAEQARQAAEAQQLTDLEDQLTQVLGNEAAVAAWNEISELSQTDAVAAARRFAELISQGRAQSSAEADQPDAPPAPAPEGGTTVDTPPAPPAGMGADASLSQRQRTLNEEESQLADQLDGQFQAVAARVQDPKTRNRTTWKERTGAMMDFVASSVLRRRVEDRKSAQNS